MGRLIDADALLDGLEKLYRRRELNAACTGNRGCTVTWNDAIYAIKDAPTAQPEKETPKRVLWTGWKGYRNTRYKCPNCKKPVKNDDVYCHRCGQKLMFPHVDWTPYVEGQKQELIVRWDNE